MGRHPLRLRSTYAVFIRRRFSVLEDAASNGLRETLSRPRRPSGRLSVAEGVRK